jgi:hypothetical protein
VSVVRFAVLRRPEAAEEDVWMLLTRAECELHAFLLSHDAGPLRAARRDFMRAAGRVAPRQRGSAKRQLRLMRDAGDPADILEPLLAFFD